MAREALSAGRSSRLAELPEVTACDVARLAQAGDALAVEVWGRAAGFLAQGVAAIVSGLAPERVVLGGGVTQAGEMLFGPLRDAVRRQVRLVPMDRVAVVRAALGGDVGLLGRAVRGAARLARE
jgi:glucokinase